MLQRGTEQPSSEYVNRTPLCWSVPCQNPVVLPHPEPGRVFRGHQAGQGDSGEENSGSIAVQEGGEEAGGG